MLPLTKLNNQRLYTNFLFSVLIRFQNAEPSAAVFDDLCKIHFSLLCCMLLFRKKSRCGIIASKEVTYFVSKQLHYKTLLRFTTEQ